MANGNDWAITFYLMVTPQTGTKPGGTEHTLFYIQRWEAGEMMGTISHRQQVFLCFLEGSPQPFVSQAGWL